jgi:hypothetical protein
MPLILGGKTIDKISGSISFYYLKPKPNKKLKDLGIVLPFIILMGDNHSGFSKTCNDCICNDGKCCLSIDETLISHIDKVANKHKVNFYIEFMIKDKKLNINNMESYNMALDTTIRNYKESYLRTISKNVYSCFFEKSGSFINSICNYKNIEFHDIDIRSHTHQQYVFEKSLSFFYNLLSNYISQGSFNTISNDQSNMLKILLNIFKNEPSSFAQNLMDNPFFTDNSYLYQKIKEISYIDNIHDSVIAYYKEFRRFKKMHIFFILLEDFYSSPSDLKKNKIKKMCKDNYIDFTNNMLILFSVILDLNYLACILNKKNNTTSLAVSYFGSAHIDHISTMLTKSLKYYDIALFKGNDYGSNRCLNIHLIKEHISIDDDLCGVISHNTGSRKRSRKRSSLQKKKIIKKRSKK